jgi:hypothetical protein
MEDFVIGILCFCGAAVSFALGVVMLRRRRAARAWAREKAAIAECAHSDRVMAEQLQLLRYIHQRWPEAIRVALDSRQVFTPEVSALVHGGPLEWRVLEAFYRERPAGVHITLNSRQHKMQICDAQRLGVRVAVHRETGRAVGPDGRAGRPNPREEEAEVGAARRQDSEERLRT